MRSSQLSTFMLKCPCGQVFCNSHACCPRCQAALTDAVAHHVGSEVAQDPVDSVEIQEQKAKVTGLRLRLRGGAARRSFDEANRLAQLLEAEEIRLSRMISAHRAARLRQDPHRHPPLPSPSKGKSVQS